MNTNKILGILLLLVFVCVATALLNDAFIKPYNLQNLLRSSSMFAIIGIGAVLVIVTGGIDLSTGSLIGLVGCTMTMTLQSFAEHPPSENGAFFFQLAGLESLLFLTGWLVRDWIRQGNPVSGSARWKIICLVFGVSMLVVSALVGQSQAGSWMTMAVAVALALLLSAHLGLLHGLLITKLGLQPFVVTLCGLMCYRGLSRYLTGDKTQGLGTDYNDSLRLLAIGKPCTVTAVVLFFSAIILAAAIWKFLSARKQNAKAGSSVNAWLLLVMGLVLAVVASSRYWNGWETNWGEPLISVAGLNLSFFSLTISETAIARPAELMSLAIYPMLLCFVALCFVSASKNLLVADSDLRRKLQWGLPLLGVATSVVALLMVKNWIGDETISLSDMSAAFQSGAASDATDQYALGINLILWKMAGVFFFMATLMGSVLWLGKTWTRNSGDAGKALWLLSGFFAVLWLAGKTAIHETVVQTPFFFLLVIGVLTALFLNKTAYGRYFFALGNNEEATRYSGINTDNVTILAYVLCALCGGIGAVLFTLDSNNVEPSGHGSFYELYAIAAAVLGGCSLRGGEGSILGVIIGASIMRVLYNAPDMIGIASQLEMFTIGFVLLIGIIVDESARRVAAKRDRKVAS